MKKVDFDEYADRYDDLLRENTGFFTENESYFARYKVDLARGLAGDTPRRIHEFGCGTGRNIPFLRSAFASAIVSGSDVSAKSIEIARKANPGVDLWVEGEGRPREAAFDLIFVAGVFHHIPPRERDGAARQIAQRLAPGGAVIVFEHNPFNPVTRKIVRDCPYDEGVLLLSPRELGKHLANGGLHLQKRGYTLFFPPRWRRMVRLERWLEWLPLGGQYWALARASIRG